MTDLTPAEIIREALERRAARAAYDAELGASEFEAFLTADERTALKAVDDLQAALDAERARNRELAEELATVDANWQACDKHCERLGAVAEAARRWIADAETNSEKGAPAYVMDAVDRIDRAALAVLEEPQ